MNEIADALRMHDLIYQLVCPVNVSFDRLVLQIKVGALFQVLTAKGVTIAELESALAKKTQRRSSGFACMACAGHNLPHSCEEVQP